MPDPVKFNMCQADSDVSKHQVWRVIVLSSEGLCDSQLAPNSDIEC
jgi:hypothetical protein